MAGDDIDFAYVKATEGGDFDPTVSASISKAEGETPRWDDFDITALAQQWVSGQAPNLGVILKAATEDIDGTSKNIRYHSDDYTVSPALRRRAINTDPTIATRIRTEVTSNGNA